MSDNLHGLHCPGCRELGHDLAPREANWDTKSRCICGQEFNTRMELDAHVGRHYIDQSSEVER